MSALVVDLLQKHGHIPSYLSRGYGRRSKGLVEVQVDSNPMEVGDEALWMKRRFPQLCVVVCENRKEGLQHIESSQSSNVVVLDDAHQHYSVKAGLQIILTTQERPFFKDHLLPSGSLRETRSGAARADMIVVTKCKDGFEKGPFDRSLSRFHKRVFYTELSYQSYWKSLSQGDHFIPVMNQSVVAFAGIASNESFFRKVRETFQLLETIGFNDHQLLDGNDIDRIVKMYQSAKNKSGSVVLLTTEKDAARLQKEVLKGPFIDLPLFTWGVNPEFLFSQTQSFETQILKYVGED